MTPRTLGFGCGCGALSGRLVDVQTHTGTRIQCHCNDCRLGYVVLGQPDPRAQGVGLFQTTPDRIRIDRGTHTLALVRLGPTGLMRWHAACCATPLFNTMARRRIPFAAVQTAAVADPDALGPVRARSFARGKDGRIIHENAGLMVTAMVSRMARAWITGTWRDTPFFDAQGAPAAPARILCRADRAAARAALPRV
jgi:hypothetical protein